MSRTQLLRARTLPLLRAVLRRLRGAAFERRVSMSGRYRYVAGETGSKPQLVSANGTPARTRALS